MIYLGILGHSHARRLLRHWHISESYTPSGLPGHTHILAYMHINPSDDTHYSHIPINNPHINAILMTWGDNDIDQPGDTISTGITYDIVRSLIALLLFFNSRNVPVFIIPPLPRSTPSLTSHPHYTTAVIYINRSLARHITDLRIPYSPLISPPSLTMSPDGIHPSTQAYEKLRQTSITHINTQLHSLRLQGITQLRSTTPLLPTPNITPSAVIYLPTLPTYISRARTTTVVTSAAIAAAPTVATPSTSSVVRRTRAMPTNSPLTSPYVTAGTSALTSHKRRRLITSLTTLPTIHEIVTPALTQSPITSTRTCPLDSFSTSLALPPPVRDPEPPSPIIIHPRRRGSSTIGQLISSVSGRTTTHVDTPHTSMSSQTAHASTSTRQITTSHRSCLFIARGRLSSISKR